MASVKCPECGARVRVREGSTRLRCPECDERFSLPDGDEEDEAPRPRRRPAARSSSSGTKIAALVVGSLFLFGVLGVAIALIVGGGGKDGGSPAADRSKVTVANFKSVKPGMDRAEVEGLLGGSSASSENDMRDAFRRAGGGLQGEIEAGFEVAFAKMGEGSTWRHWEGANLRAWVAFANTKDGQRAAFSTALEQTGGGSKRVDGFVTFGGFSDLDKLNADRKQEAALRDDPKWVRGPTARERLLGEWRDESAAGYLFDRTGRLSALSMFPALPGAGPTYRVVDDRYLEIITPSPFAPMPGHPAPPAFVNTQPTVQRYEYLVNQDELALIDASPNGGLGAHSYYRFPVRAGSAGQTRLVAPLLADLKSTDPLRRNTSYAKLRQLAKGVAVALPTLIELLRGPDETLMDYSVWIMSDMKEQAAPAVPALADLARGPNAKTALLAVRALGFIGPAAKDALPALREVAKKARAIELRFEAEQSIHRIETGQF
ncbi:HEAT repeat domain-containing protein [Frigoriglobus tundricola]|uniref:HEAT repeat domain-containing protein n=1 Tax=Frigoriglobus tundricola TaxID=2774151 RepID=A0A6M5YKX4_9BACT|nr:HEAT repeat domain-containing protein [Frigoriglobus tundricola]QJW94000.1 hypothetical protein FTUN_1517 [Frigoriglobus tundricola]